MIRPVSVAVAWHRCRTQCLVDPGVPPLHRQRIVAQAVRDDVVEGRTAGMEFVVETLPGRRVPAVDRDGDDAVTGGGQRGSRLGRWHHQSGGGHGQDEEPVSRARRIGGPGDGWRRTASRRELRRLSVQG
jgi:hypothetical protein